MTYYPRTEPPTGVFDLRTAATEGPFGPAFLGHRIAASHHPAFDFARAESAGGSGRMPAQEEFLVVALLDGRMRLAVGSVSVTLTPGEIAILAPDTTLDWEAQGACRWLLNIYCGPAAPDGGPALRKVDLASALTPSAPPAAELLIGPAPECAKLETVASTDGAWSCGLWTATPYQRVPVRYGYYEMMLLQDGVVSVFSADGRRAEFRAGDAFVVAEGAELGWHSATPVQKFWSIHTPAAAPRE